METNKNEEKCKNGNVCTHSVAHVCPLSVLLKMNKM